MRRISLPEVPYDATAVRPHWQQLPTALRVAVTERLGGTVVAASTAGAGFTRGFAAVLRTGAGDRFFVKAAPLGHPPADWYAREAAVTAALPPEVPAARPRWTMTAAGHFVLCLQAVHGRVPGLPWAPDDLAAALRAWATAATALRRPGTDLLALDPPPLPDVLADAMARWTQVRAGGAPLPPGPAYLPDRLPELAALERALPGHVGGDGITHGDLRLDNVLLDGSGTGWICDWTWPCRGAAWFDTVTLLVTAYASGLDADALLAAHPTAHDAPPEGVDGALAALSGYWLVRSGPGAATASVHSRGHHRFSGAQALAWLARRRGWA